MNTLVKFINETKAAKTVVEYGEQLASTRDSGTRHNSKDERLRSVSRNMLQSFGLP